jgi:hypothetical protein
MMRARICAVLGATAVGFGSPLLGSTPALAAPPTPAVLHVGQIAAQDVPPQPGSEPDTLVEPDVAVSPLDSRIAVAVAHDGRYPDGGAVDISYAWTHDGGRSWQHAPVPFLTKSVGGTWDRVSDPVLAFGPDGTLYLSTLLFSLGCPSAVGVSRSTDGGQTFGPPVLAHFSDSCAYSDDKDWLVVDTSQRSPHYGRLYQFWTPFLADDQGNFFASPQVVRWSDDRGAHWSETVNVSATDVFTQNSQPMIQPDGTIVDAYLNFGSAAGAEGPESRIGAEGQQTTAAAPAAELGNLLVARTSHDGGGSWGPEAVITHDAGEGPAGIRCCLPSATADPVTGMLYAAWDSATPDAVKLSRSTDGQHWSHPVRVNNGFSPTMDQVNVDVSAHSGQVFVSYGSRDTAVAGGRFIQQQVSTSYDGGGQFGPPLLLGPRSDLQFAAQAGGAFPGDYIGGAATDGRVYLVWCRSSQPPDPTATYHQTLYAAVLQP